MQYNQNAHGIKSGKYPVEKHSDCKDANLQANSQRVVGEFR